MRKDSTEEVTEVARRRLATLRRELSGAATESPALPEVPELAAPAMVPPAGRHVRDARGSWSGLSGWLEDRLPTTLRGRVGIGSREVALVVVLAALGLAVAAVVVLRSGSGGDPVALARAKVPLTSSASALVSAPPTASPSASASTRITVDVSGRVRHPGVVRLPSGARVIDALRKAGGARHRVDLNTLNLARVLTDGEQVVVGPGATTPGVAASAAAAEPNAGALVNLNTATEEQLETLPGIGPVTAQKILSWRTAHGSFSSVDELMEVDGIGPKTLADLAPHATL